MDILALVFVIQILLESLPVSSTGHLILLLKMSGSGITFSNSLIQDVYYVAHGATVIVTLLFFYPFWRKLLLEMWHKKTIFIRPFIFFFIIESITLSGYYCFFNFFSSISLSLGFMCTACILFSLRFIRGESTIFLWSLRNAFLIGLVQMVAFVPGISRFAATFTMARWCKIDSYNSFALSSLASVPLSLGGFLLGIAQIQWLDIPFSPLKYMVLGITASVGAYILMKGVWYLMRNGRLWWISWYMLLPIVVSLIV